LKSFHDLIFFGKVASPTSFQGKDYCSIYTETLLMNYDLKYRTVIVMPSAFVLRAEGRTDLCRLKEWFTNRRWIRSSNIEQYTIRCKKYHGGKGKD